MTYRKKYGSYFRLNVTKSCRISEFKMTEFKMTRFLLRRKAVNSYQRFVC